MKCYAILLLCGLLVSRPSGLKHRLKSMPARFCRMSEDK